MNELLRRLVEFTGDGVYRYRFDDGVILLANRGFLQILELDGDPESVVGKRLSEVLVYTAPPGLIRRTILEKGGVTGYEYHFKTLKGHDRWVVHDSVLHTDPKTGARCVDALIKDITERKQAERLAAMEREKLMVTLHSIGDAVIATDCEGRVELMNAVAVQLTGWPEAEARGRPLPEVFRIVNEYTRQPCENPVAKVLKTGQVVGLANHTCLLSRHGEEFCIADSGAPIRMPNGEVTGVVLVFRDVTEQRRAAERLAESEVRFRTLFHSMVGASALHEMIFDEAGRPRDYVFLDVNPAFEQMTGLRRDDVVGRRVLEVIPNLEPEWMERYGQVVRTGEPAHFTQYSAALGRWYEVTAFRPSPGRFAVTFLDVTERHRAAERMAAALREKEALLREVHHRVKNNLQIMSSLISLQAAGARSESTRAVLREMQSRVKSMALIHEKLYQSENLADIPLQNYLQTLTDHALRSFGRGAEAVRLRVDCGRVALDPDRTVSCGLIVNELVWNALKHAFSAAKSGEIAVQFRRDKDSYRLMVADNGVGLKMRNPGRRRRSLGLQLVETLASQLGGALEVAELTPGTAFAVRFPMKRDAEKGGE